MSTFIYFLIDIFIILDCDTALSEEKEAKPQSERKQLGKVTKINFHVHVKVISTVLLHPSIPTACIYANSG